MRDIWHIVVSELSYHRWSLLSGYAGLALVYGLMTTDRLAYTLLLGYMIGYSALLLLLSEVRENREQLMVQLPVSQWALFLTRLATPLLFCAGAVVIVGLLMLLPAYQALHDDLWLRLPGAFLVMAFYFVSAFSLGDLKLEKQRSLLRFIYPGLAMAAWMTLYMLYLLDWSEESEAMGTGIFPVTRFLYETPGGIALLIAIIGVMFYVNWCLYQRRTRFLK